MPLWDALTESSWDSLTEALWVGVYAGAGDLIQIRRGPAAIWTSVNPTLADGELGFETDTRKHKLGDGVTPWTSLAYAGSAASGSTGYVQYNNNGAFSSNSTFTFTDLAGWDGLDETAWDALDETAWDALGSSSATLTAPLFSGSGASLTTLNASNLSSGTAATARLSNAINVAITGYTSGAGTVAATDTILQAIQKLNGNDATNANLTGPITSTGNATAIASQTGTGTTFAMSASPTFTGTVELAAAEATDAAATTPGETSVSGLTNGSGDYNVGYRFVPNVNGTVTHLGFYSRDTASTTVRLYNSGGTVIGSGTATGIGGDAWQRIAITPVALTAGNTYTVSVRSSLYAYATLAAPITSGGITIHSGRYIAASDALPTTLGGGVYYLADVTFVAGTIAVTGNATVTGALSSTTLAATAKLTLTSFTNNDPKQGELWYNGTNLLFRDSTTTRTITWV